MYKVTHSRQGDSFGGNGGWITYLSNTAKPFHLYKNTFLQLTSRFLYCDQDSSHHCIARNQWRYVMQDQCPHLQVNRPAGNKRATLDDTFWVCHRAAFNQTITLTFASKPPALGGNLWFRYNESKPPAERKISKWANTRRKSRPQFRLPSDNFKMLKILLTVQTGPLWINGDLFIFLKTNEDKMLLWIPFEIQGDNGDRWHWQAIQLRVHPEIYILPGDQSERNRLHSSPFCWYVCFQLGFRNKSQQ